jgi:hypothetical protein
MHALLESTATTMQLPSDLLPVVSSLRRCCSREERGEGSTYTGRHAMIVAFFILLSTG